jgi:branched-chain amino acid transport system substrate-binding protein
MTLASDAEIKIGNIAPYSGPLSAYALIARTIGAYFNKVNVEGGVNGRTIRFISHDDGFSPSKTVEQARKLVESNEVLLIFNSLGTPTNLAIQRYMNAKKVPQLFVASGATAFGDYQKYPWTMGWAPTFETEGHVYANYVNENHPKGRIAILYQNDDSGKDYVKGVKDGIVGKLPIIAEASYEVSDPTVDSQLLTLKASGADIFLNLSQAKLAAQAIRKAAELGWRPVQILASISASVGSVFKPAGLENAKGLLTGAYLKDPTDSTWKNDPAFEEWRTFMEKYLPDGDRTSTFAVYGYLTAQTMVRVLSQCGDDLTRENVIKQATSIKDLQFGMLLPGISINTAANDYHPVKHMKMARFNGVNLEPFGPVLSGALPNH